MTNELIDACFHVLGGITAGFLGACLLMFLYQLTEKEVIAIDPVRQKGGSSERE